MFIITYGKKKLTFKAETIEDAEKLLRRCEEAQGQLTPEVPESAAKVMTAEEYLAVENLKSLDGVFFDDPLYL
jgi:hypothetical protein